MDNKKRGDKIKQEKFSLKSKLNITNNILNNSKGGEGSVLVRWNGDWGVNAKTALGILTIIILSSILLALLFLPSFLVIPNEVIN